MRNAWLIIAHNEFGILQKLISSLDNAQSDIYVHIDKKVKQMPEIHADKSRIILLEDRVDVRWGTVSQIRAELTLLEAAAKRGPYSHYHILSGTHLPLKCLSDLMAFYGDHKNETVVRCWQEDAGDADFKLRRYHFPLRHFKYGSSFQRLLCQNTWNFIIKVQKILGIRHWKDEKFIKTDNWLSLSEDDCQYLIMHRKEILDKYRWSFCGDEYFVASELAKGGKSFYSFPKLLYVEFQGDTPRTFNISYLPVLQSSDYLWARKFSSDNAN